MNLKNKITLSFERNTAMNNDIHVLSRAIIIQEEHILLAYDPRTPPHHYYELNKPFYYLPGGHVEFKESAQNAVRREIEEEMGHPSTAIKFLGIIEHERSFPGDEVCCHTHEVNLIFQVDIPNLKANSMIPQRESHVAFEWFPIEKLQNIDLRPNVLLSLIPEWIKATPHNIFHSTMIE